MIKGTERMVRYPIEGADHRELGINHYGRVKTAHGTAYKVAPYNVAQLESIGWLQVGTGILYAHMLLASGEGQ